VSASGQALRPAHPHASEAQAAAIARLRGRPAAVPGGPGSAPERIYAGLVTRTVAFALDATIVNGSAALAAVALGLAVSILHLPAQVDAAVAGVAGVVWVLWSIAYFTFFWSTTGETPGDRVMGIRVVDKHDRGPLKPRRAAVRYGALILAVIPLLAGILMMLWDDRGRCLQDRLARTVVIHAPAPRPVPASASGTSVAGAPTSPLLAPERG
jgi:uncharacterized RDD family membrane protein YckC